MSEDQSSPPACALHPGATLHKIGKARDGSQRYRCPLCRPTDPESRAAALARYWETHKAPRKRTPEGQEAERARKRAAYLKAKEAKKSLKVVPQPLDKGGIGAL